MAQKHLFAPLLLILALFCSAYATSCGVSIQRGFEGNDTFSVITLKIANANSASNCTFGKFNVTEEIPQRLEMQSLNYSLQPAKIEGRNATWALNSLQTGETLTLTYSTDNWVAPRIMREFRNLTINFEIPKMKRANQTANASNLSYAPISGENGSYFVMSNQEKVALAKGSNASSPRLITNAGEAAAMLSAFYGTKGKDGMLAAIESAHLSVISFSASREPYESSCRVLTGTDRTKCVSFDSCQYACYSVTSFCLPIALGSGRETINDIWLLANQTSALTSALETENKSYVQAIHGPSPSTISTYENSLVEINRKAGEALSNPLINWLCVEPKYDLAGLSAATERVRRASDDFSAAYEYVYEAEKYAFFAQNETERKNRELALSANNSGNGASNSAAMQNATGQSTANSSPSNASARIAALQENPAVQNAMLSDANPLFGTTSGFGIPLVIAAIGLIGLALILSRQGKKKKA